MTFATHENGYLVNCLNCNHEITYLEDDHHYCSQCGFPIRNECTGTVAHFRDEFSSGPVPHDFDEEEFVLKPEDAYCPKCGSESLFNEKNLIEVKHPKVEVIEPNQFADINDDDLPY